MPTFRTKKATTKAVITMAVNLKILRNRKGFSQQEVAKMIGIKQTRLGHWETGFASPDYTMLVKMCDLYGYEDIYKMLTEVI